MPAIRQSNRPSHAAQPDGLRQHSLFTDDDFVLPAPQPRERLRAAKPTLPAEPVYIAVDAEAASALSAQEAARLWSEVPLHAFGLWMKNRTTHTRAFGKHSVAQYSSMFSGYLKFLMKETTHGLLDATMHDVESFLTTKEGRDGRAAAATTRRRYMHLIFGIYGHLVEEGLVPHNPVEMLVEASGKGFQRPPPTALREREMKAYVAWVQKQEIGGWCDRRDKAMRLLFLASGVTVAELQALTVSDLQVPDDPAEPLTLDIQAHGFAPKHVAPVSEFAREAVLDWVAFLTKHAPGIDRLFPAREFGFNVDRPVDESISSPECYLVVKAAMDGIKYQHSRLGPQTLRNSFIAHQIWEKREPSRIAAWVGLRTNETINKIRLLVAVLNDGVGPASFTFEAEPA